MHLIKALRLIAIGTFLFPLASANAEMLSVKGDNVNLRESPTIQSEIKWEYSSGFPVKVLKKKGNWRYVEDFEEARGWIYNSLLSSSHYVIVKANKNSDETINIRSGPGKENDVIGRAYYGVVFKLLDRDTDSKWVLIEHEQPATKGWVHGSFLWGLESD